jgi:hypothetical protein
VGVKGGPDPQSLLSDRVTRQQFGPRSPSGGGHAPEPGLASATKDTWRARRVSHRPHAP